MSLVLHTPGEVATQLAERVRDRRLARRWTQAELARRSGVALSTLKLFEHTAQISLDRLLRIAAALDDLDSFAMVFAPPPARSLAELDAASVRPRPRRGKRGAP